MPAVQAFLDLLRRRRRFVAALLAAFALYALAGFVLLPQLLRSAAGDYVAQRLGRQLTLGPLQFNPFSFELRIRDLALREGDGAPLLGFRTLIVNFEPWRSLFTGSLAFKEVTLDGPDLGIVIAADGRLNLAQLAPATDAVPPPAGTTTAIPRLRIAALTISDGRIAFDDRSRPQPFHAELQPIRIALADFRTTADYANRYRVEAATPAGERLDWSGTFTVQPLAAQGEFGLHGLLAKTVDAYLQDQLPVQLRSGRLDLNGRYTLALQPALELDVTLPTATLRDLSVAARSAAADSRPPVAVRQLGVDTLDFSLAHRALTIKAVDVDGARLDLRRARDGSINLLQLAGTAAPQTGAAQAAPAAAPPAAPMRVAVERVQLHDAGIDVEDRTVQPAAHFTLAPIAATVGGYSSDPQATLDVDAKLTVDGAAHLAAQGKLQLQPLHTQLALQLDGFALAAAQPYIAQATNATVHGGTLAVRGNLDLAQVDGRLPLRFRGDVTVDDFRASGKGEGRDRRNDFARWQQLTVDGIDFSMAPDRLGIERVTLSRPFARVVINADQTLNVAQILKPASAAAPTPAAAPATRNPGTAMPIRIRQIRIRDGAAFFADRSIEPSFAAGIVALDGGIANLSSDPAARATIELDGRVDRHSPVEIRGTSSLLAATEDSDIRLAFRNMELTTFNPYSGKFAGYNIAKGKLTTELSYRLDHRRLEAEHHVVLDQLEFGEATHSKDAAPLPVKLAVALLKDRNGVIDLDLPVRGSLDDPDFKYGKLVWKVLGNVLTKIVSAPFAALGSLFGRGEELSYIDFAPGAATLTPRAADKLGTLAKALVERPQLKLDVPATAGETDRDALAVGALAAALPAAGGDDRARLRACEQLYKERLRQAPPYPQGSDTPAARLAWIEPQLLAALAPDDDALQRLARRRARAVQDALLARPELSAERIFITTGEPPQAGDDGMVRLALKLR